MDVISKWRLGEKLTIEEAIEIIDELFGGSNKQFNFDNSKKIDNSLYNLYQKFNHNDNEYTINFSNSRTNYPIISLIEIDKKPSYTIRTFDFDIYIYEKPTI